MRTDVAETIFAVASGPGPAGVAVLRISGPGARPTLAALAGRDRFAPRRATRVRLHDAAGEVLDEALAVWFPSPASFTGEDVVELHVHGGRAVTGGVLEALAARRGLRPALAGEFCRRAFENGKLDLTQAEATADLVAAESAAQRKQAIRQLSGSLRELYEGWRQRLLGAMVRLEAAIDFSDEDIPDGLRATVAAEVASLRGELDRHLADGGIGEKVRDGLSIVLLGAPNAGKSTLVNALCGRDVSIVDSEAGTTRDIVSAEMVIGGFKVTISDTAGLRAGGGRVETEGVRRALALAARADIRVLVLDGAIWPGGDPGVAALDDDIPSVPVVTKQDLRTTEVPVVVGGVEAVLVSAVTGWGVETLRGRLADVVRAGWDAGEAVVLTRERHRRGLEGCLAALVRAGSASADELLAEDLRTAAASLGQLVGRVDVEDVLDGIFREFCIGK